MTALVPGILIGVGVIGMGVHIARSLRRSSHGDSPRRGRPDSQHDLLWSKQPDRKSTSRRSGPPRS